MTTEQKPREWWIKQGEYEGDIGIGNYFYSCVWDHAPDFKNDFIHVIEKQAYDKLERENEELKEALSYLPKVPTQPYEKELAQEISRLKAELEKAKGEIKRLEVWSSDSHIQDVEKENEELKRLACFVQGGQPNQIPLLRMEVESLQRELEKAKKQVEIWRDGENALYGECKQLELLAERYRAKLVECMRLAEKTKFYGWRASAELETFIFKTRQALAQEKGDE